MDRLKEILIHKKKYLIS